MAGAGSGRRQSLLKQGSFIAAMRLNADARLPARASGRAPDRVSDGLLANAEIQRCCCVL